MKQNTTFSTECLSHANYFLYCLKKTMRTIWLVEERSFQKGLKKRGQSRYRPIQFFYDAGFFVARLGRSILKVCVWMRYVERARAILYRPGDQVSCSLFSCSLSIVDTYGSYSRAAAVVNYRSF
jgi:hypothetical protein